MRISSLLSTIKVPIRDLKHPKDVISKFESAVLIKPDSFYTHTTCKGRMLFEALVR